MAETVEGPRPRMTLTAKLVAIVLGIDLFVVIFAMLAAFGLRRLEPGVAFGLGAALIVLCLLGAGLVRRRQVVAVAIGWLVQVVLVMSGVLLLPMYLVGGGSLILWVWCLWRGAKADRALATSAPGGPAA